MKSKTTGILLHILGCIIFLSLPILLRPGSMGAADVFDDPRSRLDFFTYVLMIVFFYLNYFVFVPQFYFENKYFFFGLVMVLCFAFIVFVPEAIVGHRPPPGEPPPPKPRGPGGFMLFRTGNVFFLFMIAFFLSLIIRISSRWKQTEQEKLSAELSY